MKDICALTLSITISSVPLYFYNPFTFSTRLKSLFSPVSSSRRSSSGVQHRGGLHHPQPAAPAAVANPGYFQPSTPPATSQAAAGTYFTPAPVSAHDNGFYGQPPLPPPSTFGAAGARSGTPVSPPNIFNPAAAVPDVSAPPPMGLPPSMGGHEATHGTWPVYLVINEPSSVQKKSSVF